MSIEPTRKEIKDYDPKHIYETANSYLLAYERCIEMRPLENGRFEMLASPAIVCLAFSCELFIKSILQIHKMLQKKAGHKLDTLFGQLSEGIRNRIIAKIGTTGFDYKIQNASNAFEEWRYIYELGSNYEDIEFLCCLAYSLKNAAHEELEKRL